MKHSSRPSSATKEAESLERSATRKLTNHLVPIFFGMTLLCWLDRTSLAFAGMLTSFVLALSQQEPHHIALHARSSLHSLACADVSGLAALQLNEDLGFSEAIYGLGASIFFVGYSLFQVSGMPAHGCADRSEPDHQQLLRPTNLHPTAIHLLYCSSAC